MSALERNPQVPAGPEFTQGLRPRHQRERNSERPPRNSHGDWPFLRPPERVPEGPVGKNSRRSRRISRGGALHRKGERNSRVVPPFQESPRCVSPFQRNRFSLHCHDVQAEDRLPPRVHVGQPCGKASWESLVGKTRGKTIDALIHGADCVTLLLPLWRKAERIPGVPVASQEEALSTGKARGTPGSCHHSKSPPDVSVHSRGTGFPCTAMTFKPRIDSHHVCTWDSPVGKPRGKDTRENHRCFDPRGGLRDTAATALEESASACPHSRRGLTPLGRLQKYPKIHVSTGEESSGSGPEFTQGLRPRHQRERNSERPPRNSHGDWPFLRPPERVPEGPVPRIDSHHVCTWDSPVGKPRGKDTRENHRCFDPRGGLRDTAATALEESASACPHSRRGLTPLGRLQKYPKIHVSTGEESSGSGPEFTQGLRPRHQRERNSERPPRNSHGDWPFLRPPERVPEGPVKYPKIHVSTGEESSGSGPEFTQGLRPRHQRERNSERPPRNSHGDWPFLRPPERVPEGPVGKNSRRSRRISRGGALHRKGERNSRVVPPFQESPRCVSPFQRNRFSLHCLDVQAEDRLPPRVHVGQPCGKASWESLVGKTRGKTIDALIHGADCVTLLLPLWRKAQVHARIRDED
ncbi:hypothetical protein MJG53_000205 [Ovis ammon polii x Ovis aries]|nr:hypothetical protein MJG53_000205 [Ovis ammon polii x Ovis aries]